MIKIDKLLILQIALIIAIVILASNNINGWGWLILTLLITID